MERVNAQGGVKRNMGKAFDEHSSNFNSNKDIFASHKFKKLAFTLSEVLITLVIIGVVAAITIPIVHANSQDKALKSALKKSYSVIGQALERYYFDNGIRLVPGDMETGRYMKDILKKNLNVLQDCGYHGRGVYPCIGDSVANVYKTYNGKATVEGHNFDDGQLALMDGTYLMLENATGGDLYMSVDVNGTGRKPNRLGKDLFFFQIMKDGSLKPMGAKGTKYPKETHCSRTSSHNMNGAGCTAAILIEH